MGVRGHDGRHLQLIASLALSSRSVCRLTRAG